MITAAMMQQLWAIIESTQVSILLQFEDSALVDLLLKQVVTEQAIDNQAMGGLDTYIQAKLPLIRDIAASKLCMRQGAY